MGNQLNVARQREAHVNALCLDLRDPRECADGVFFGKFLTDDQLLGRGVGCRCGTFEGKSLARVHHPCIEERIDSQIFSVPTPAFLTVKQVVFLGFLHNFDRRRVSANLFGLRRALPKLAVFFTYASSAPTFYTQNHVQTAYSFFATPCTVGVSFLIRRWESGVF